MHRAILCASLILAYTPIFAQNSSQFDKNKLFQQAGERIFVDQSLDNSLAFSGYFSAVANFVGSQNNTITLQPTLYALNNIIHGRSTTIDTTYAKEVFARNFQINLGITPNAKDFFSKPTDYQAGFTFALLNNKDIPLEYFDISSGPWKRFSEMWDTLNQYLYGLHARLTKADYHRIIAIADSGYYELLPDTIYNYLRKNFGDVMGRDFQKKMVDSLSKALSRQSLLTLGGNAIYGLTSYWWDDFTITAAYSKYILPQKGFWIDPSVDLTASYSVEDDTSKIGKNSQREVFQLSAEFNLRMSNFEIRPGVSLKNIPKGLYKKETQNKVSPTADFDLKIADKTVVALTLNYDKDIGKLTGGLKIQSSLR